MLDFHESRGEKGLELDWEGGGHLGGGTLFRFGPLIYNKSKTKQRMVFRMIHGKDSDSLLPMGKVWSLDFQGKVKDGP